MAGSPALGSSLSCLGVSIVSGLYIEEMASPETWVETKELSPSPWLANDTVSSGRDTRILEARLTLM